MLRLASALILISALALSACGSDDDSDTTITKSLSGTVTYTGSLAGTLMVAASTLAMPQCPADTPEQYVTVLNATFPYTYTLTGLKGGDYYVSALFDVQADLPFPPCPRADDVCGRSTTFVTVSDTAPNGTLNFDLNVPGCGVSE